jgi:anti-sigma factor RsiW
MTTHIDVKAYAVGELSESDKRSAAAHVASCSSCREELGGLQVTLGSLAMLRDEEMPRRITFVSDKQVEPRWWQNMFSPTFASACVLAGAIVFHGLSNQGPSEAVIQARVQQQVGQAVAEMEDRLMVLDQQNKMKEQTIKTAMNLVTY